MESIRSLIVAADELFADGAAGPSPEDLATLDDLARLGCEVWLAGTAPALGELERELHRWVEAGRLRRASSLQEAARRCLAEGPRVMVVGASPAGSVRFANERGFASALVVSPDPGAGHQPEDLLELPDFVVTSLDDVMALLRRLERAPEDFEGTE